MRTTIVIRTYRSAVMAHFSAHLVAICTTSNRNYAPSFRCPDIWQYGRRAALHKLQCTAL